MNELSELKVKWTGIRPLIMSNPQTVDIECPYSMASRKLNGDLKSMRKKEDDTMLVQISRKQKENDFCASAYFDSSAKKFFLPDAVIMACIKASATSLRKGKDIDRTVIMEETQAYIVGVPSVSSLEDAYKNEAFHFLTPAKIPPKTGSLMMKMRCKMPTGWSLVFKLQFDESIITKESLREILLNAGSLVGVGGWRPKFGRFTVDFS